MPQWPARLRVDLEDDPAKHCCDRRSFPDRLALHHLRDAWVLRARRRFEELVDSLRIGLGSQQQDHLRPRRQLLLEELDEVPALVCAGDPYWVSHLHREGDRRDVPERPQPDVDDRHVGLGVDEEPVVQAYRALQAVPHPPLEVALLDHVPLLAAEDHLQRLEYARVDLLGLLVERHPPVLHELGHRLYGQGARVPEDRAVRHVLREAQDRGQPLQGRGLRQPQRLAHHVLVLPHLVVHAGEGAELRHQEDALRVLLGVGLQQRLPLLGDLPVVVGHVELQEGHRVLLALFSLVHFELVGGVLLEVHRLDPVDPVVVQRDHCCAEAASPPLGLHVDVFQVHRVGVQAAGQGLDDVALVQRAGHDVDLYLRPDAVQRT
mmetsp:Transcript_34138/g.95989  ORF Transcript_34138/g.95989 Transcript_34138/m.95989 type:complete len:377 (-) Transcript_34138:661-1791(-)